MSHRSDRYESTVDTFGARITLHVAALDDTADLDEEPNGPPDTIVVGWQIASQNVNVHLTRRAATILQAMLDEALRA